MASKFTVSAIFKAVDRVSRPLRKMEAGVERFNRRFGKTLQTSSRGMNKFSTGVFRTSAVLGGLATIIGVDLVKSTADFDRAVGKAGAKFGIAKGTEEYKKLEDSIRSAALATEFTAMESANAMGFYAKAGKSAAFGIGTLESAMNLATATSTDFAESTNMVTDLMGSFGLNTGDTQEEIKGFTRLVNALAVGTNSANFGLVEMFETAKQSGPQFVQMGGSMEEFISGTAALADSGIKASLAGTAMKNIAVALTGSTAKSLGVMKNDLRIKINDEEGNMKTPLALLEEVRKKLEPMGTQKKFQHLTGLFGKIPLAAGTVLTSEQGVDSMMRTLDKLVTAKTDAQKLADAIRDDLKGSTDKWVSALENLKLEVFMGQKNGFRDYVDKSTASIIRFTEHIKRNPKEVNKVFASIARLLKQLMAFGKFLVKLLPTLVEWAPAILKTAVALKVMSVVLGTVNGLMTLLASKSLTTIFDPTNVMKATKALKGMSAAQLASNATKSLGGGATAVRTASVAAGAASGATVAGGIGVVLKMIGGFLLRVVPIALLLGYAAKQVWDNFDGIIDGLRAMSDMFLGMFGTNTVRTVDNIKTGVDWVFQKFDDGFTGIKVIVIGFFALMAKGLSELLKIAPDWMTSKATRRTAEEMVKQLGKDMEAEVDASNKRRAEREASRETGGTLKGKINVGVDVGVKIKKGGQPAEVEEITYDNGMEMLSTGAF